MASVTGNGVCRIGDRRPADIGADRVDRAMREIDQIGDAEDQRETDRQQRVDVADDEAVDGVVEAKEAQTALRARLRAAQLVCGFTPSHSVNLPSLTIR